MFDIFFNVYKFRSDKLAQYDYEITTDIDKAVKLNELIRVFQNQIILSVFDIRNESIENDKFCEDIVVLNINLESHRKHLNKHGFILNGQNYRRLSVSSSQGRKSEAIYVNAKIYNKLWLRLNNGRDMSVKFNSAKFNAYFGLYSGGLNIIKTPKFCVVEDCFLQSKVKCNWVFETEYDKDDVIKFREVDHEYNLFDGMGIMSPQYAEQVSQELKINYTPCNIRITAPYIKGMVCTFDFVEFAKQKNNNSYEIVDIYNNKYDVRDLDMILTKSQFKMYKAYKSTEQYLSNVKKNKLYFGVSLVNKEKDNEYCTSNYQFLQTLDLSDEQIQGLTQYTKDLFVDVCENNFQKAVFFLNKNATENGYKDLFGKTDYDVFLKIVCKFLIANPNIVNEPYIHDSLKRMIKNRILDACKGKVYIKGNYSTLISDPYAFCEHIFGLEVKGLLPTTKYYSYFWNNKNAKKINSMRSPLTTYSEHKLLDLSNTEEQKEWYKYIYSGLICNIYDNHTICWQGSDWDFDIICTTDDENIIQGVRKGVYPTMFDNSSGKSGIIKLENSHKLAKSDKFVAQSRIGGITNDFACLQAILDNFPKDSLEYKLGTKRMLSATFYQNRQIDKAKIGESVKDIPKHWKNEIEEHHDVDYMKANNNILINKKPYFFIYVYDTIKAEYNKYYAKFNKNATIEFGKSLELLLSDTHHLTSKEKILVNDFYENCPVVITNSTMNRVCYNVEEFYKNYHPQQKRDKFDYQILLRDKRTRFSYKEFSDFFDKLYNEFFPKENNKSKQLNFEFSVKCIRDRIVEKYKSVDSVYNYIIKYFYKDCKNQSKLFMFVLLQDEILKTLASKNDNDIIFPISSTDNDYDEELMGMKFKLKSMSGGEFIESYL